VLRTKPPFLSFPFISITILFPSYELLLLSAAAFPAARPFIVLPHLCAPLDQRPKSETQKQSQNILSSPGKYTRGCLSTSAPASTHLTLFSLLLLAQVRFGSPACYALGGQRIHTISLQDCLCLLSSIRRVSLLCGANPVGYQAGSPPPPICGCT
jgi:hypothetical protein